MLRSNRFRGLSSGKGRVERCSLTAPRGLRSYGAGVGLGDGRVNHLRFGPNGGLWASTEGGLSRVKDEHIATMTQKNGLPCDEIHWSMEDADHAVWLYMPCGLVRIARSRNISARGVVDAYCGFPGSVLGIWNIISRPGDPWACIFFATIGAGLALLGPGTWSVDARLFGWKRIDVHDRKS
jgi:hypothetical protein